MDHPSLSVLLTKHGCQRKGFFLVLVCKRDWAVFGEKARRQIERAAGVHDILSEGAHATEKTPNKVLLRR